MVWSRWCRVPAMSVQQCRAEHRQRHHEPGIPMESIAGYHQHEGLCLGSRKTHHRFRTSLAFNSTREWRRIHVEWEGGRPALAKQLRSVNQPWRYLKLSASFLRLTPEIPLHGPIAVVRKHDYSSISVFELHALSTSSKYGFGDNWAMTLASASLGQDFRSTKAASSFRSCCVSRRSTSSLLSHCWPLRQML
jgi:hypothetical protein